MHENIRNGFSQADTIKYLMCFIEKRLHRLKTKYINYQTNL